MRCKACNTKLTNSESVAKDPQNKSEYLDLCSRCLSEIYNSNSDLPLVDNFLDK